LLPAVVFWGLDAYYLWHERLFREVYKGAVAGTVAVYSMDLSAFKGSTTWKRTLVSRTIWPIYALLIVVGLLLVADGAPHTSPARQGPSKAALMVARTSSCTWSLRFSFGGQISPSWSPSQRGTTWTWRCGTV
jgi:hypothetical protein